MGKPLTILFFGRPGAGKSTQAEIITAYLRKRSGRPTLPFLWSYVRDEFMRGNSFVREKIKENHEAGKLQPLFFSISIWGPLFLRRLSGNENLVIDGIPRQLFEAQALDSALEFFDRDEVLILNLNISAETGAERMRARARQEGRVDDANEESISRRLAWFDSDTLPILDLFRKKGSYTIIDIDATQPRERVSADIQNAVAGHIDSVRSEEIERSGTQTIVMSIGMPGAGKTSFLKPFAARNGLVFISRDDIRQEFFGNPIVQTDKDRVWKEAERRLRTALTQGENVAYDATFADQQKRRDFIKTLRDMGWKRIVGMYVDTPLEIAKERNRSRDHVVPDDVLEKEYALPLKANPPSLNDGFDELYTLADADAFEYQFSASEA